MNAFVRSRLCYNIATWNNPDDLFVKKLDIAWHRMLREVVKNGFKRKPDSKAFIYSNKDLLRITGCQSIDIFAEKQQAKWLAHCVRMENDALQKLSLFMTTTKKNYKSVWSRIESRLGMDRQQFWKLARDKLSFNRYMNSRYGSFEDESSTWSTRIYVCVYGTITANWYKKNYLKSKYKAMVMARKKYELHNRDLVIDNTEICQQEKFKLLGVILDKELNFTYHTATICTTNSRKIGIPTRMRKLIPIHANLQIYKSAIQWQEQTRAC